MAMVWVIAYKNDDKKNKKAITALSGYGFLKSSFVTLV